MDRPTPEDSIALMMRVRGGDESAFETLFNRHQLSLLNFFHGLSRNNGLARDLTQETFLRVWKIRKRYQASGTFKAYLFGIARMIWLESCRREQKTWRLGHRVGEEYVDELATRVSDSPVFRARQAELHDRIHAAIAELPEEQRMVFVLRAIEGLSLADIASVLDCPVNTVRSRKILAIKKLRHLLAPVLFSDAPVDFSLHG